MSKFLAGVKEFFRKRMVALKRKPQTIVLLGLLVAFVYYSLNLTKISNTTAAFNEAGNGMGLCEFAMMLLLVLVMVCFLNAFPHRKKVNIPMLVLMLAMIGVVIFCNFKYESGIDNALQQRYDNAYDKYIKDSNEDFAEAYGYLAEAEQLVADVNSTLEEAETDKQAADLIVSQIEQSGGDATAAKTAQETLGKAIETLQKWADGMAEDAAAVQDEIENIKNAADGSVVSSSTRKAKNALKDMKKGRNVSKKYEEVVAARDAAEAAALAAGLTIEELGLPARVEFTGPENAVEKVEIVLPQFIIDEACAEGEAAEKETKDNNPDVMKAKNVMRVHRIIMYIALALIVLLPVYKPLLRKVRTSIEVETTKEMGEIELDGSGE